MSSAVDARLVVRDPQQALQALRVAWQPHAERWVFGYTSLIWRPESETAAALAAQGVHDREIERLMALARRHGLL